MVPQAVSEFEPPTRGGIIVYSVMLRRRSLTRSSSIQHPLFYHLSRLRNDTVMTDQKLTRRDWFRLRKPHQNQLLSTQSAAATSSPTPLSSIEHPVNHHGMDLSQLPPMSEAELVTEQVDDLIADIRQLGTHVTLMYRGISELYAGELSGSALDQLLAARGELLSGRLSRVQVRYQWDGYSWIDTLEARNGNFRLVRIRHDRS